MEPLAMEVQRDSPKGPSVISAIVRKNLLRNVLQTSVKVLGISIEVTIILSFVGIQHGMGLNPTIVRLNFGIYVSVLLLFAFAVSFIFVAIGRYVEVIEMTQEIGILRILGASMVYLLGILYQETFLVTILGTTAGIIMTYGAEWVVARAFSDYLTLETVYRWWPIAGTISAVGPLLGAAFALRKSVTQGVLQALSPEE
jgi:predicted lysophospholipase L1 biosynthesis ABC-type transport system permease subunit